MSSIRCRKTGSEDLQTEAFECETVISAQCFKERGQFFVRDFNDLAALFADDMQVVGDPVRFFVVRVFVAEVDFCDQMAFEEKVERMVDRSSRYAHSFFLETYEYFIGIEMARSFVKFAQDDKPFGRTAHAVFFHVRLEQRFGLYKLFAALFSAL